MRYFLPTLLLTACIPDFPTKKFLDDPTHDYDGDGQTELDGDCDDDNPTIYDGAAEVCDARDNDCDGRTDEMTDENDGILVTEAPIWYRDDDGDGYGELDTPTAACELPDGHAAEAGDCDDDRPTVNPGAQEFCNDGIDDDCDGQIDDADDDMVGDATWYRDADADGYGDATDTVETCAAPTGYVLNNEDCNDAERRTYPGAAEFCDGIDNDCDGAVDDEDPDGVVGPARWFTDADEDGYGDPLVWTESCAAPPGTTADNTDCDDTAPGSHPGAAEYCDARDNNCNGIIDEDSAIDALTFYADSDGDGFGDATRSTQACLLPTFFSTDDSDCDDGRAEVYPGAPERCDTPIDDDCDGETNDVDATGCTVYFYDADEDGHGDPDTSRCQCTTDVVATGETGPGHNTLLADDCDDTTAAVNPSETENCATGFDDNCNGSINDEGAVGCETWYRDEDGDGDGTTDGICVCETHSPYLATNNLDCDDDNGDVWTGAEELCGDGIDNNCEGTVDGSEATDAIVWYRDDDGDGFGTPLATLTRCSEPAGHVTIAGDCDDDRDGVNPSMVEDCLTVWDDDCSDSLNDLDALGCVVFYADEDGDGYGVEGDTECRCTADASGVYTSRTADDCDDTNAGISPGDIEVCDDDGADEDCNGVANHEDAGGCEVYFYDNDGDGFGIDDRRCLCEPDEYYDALKPGDCNDEDLNINPDTDECGLNGPVSTDQAAAVITGREHFDASLYDYQALAALDYDRDGVPDVAMGSPGQDNVYASSGAVYLWLGPVTGNHEATLAGDADLIFVVDDAVNLRLGSYLSAGDVDNDGFDELLIGSAHQEAILDNSYLLDDGLTGMGVVSPDTAGVTTFEGTRSVILGDVNGDEYADAWIGDITEGWESSGYFAYGSDGGLRKSDVHGIDKLRISAEVGSSSYSICVGIESGDLDGDGFNDVAYIAGSAWSTLRLLAGGPDSWPRDTDSDEMDAGDAESSWTAFTAHTDTVDTSPVNPESGRGVSDRNCFYIVDDITGDGRADFLWREMVDNGDTNVFTGDYATSAGRIWIFEGGFHEGQLAILSDGVPATSMEDAGLQIYGAASSQYFAAQVASAGDVNGDSFNDLLITSNSSYWDIATTTTLWYGPLEMTGASISSAEADATWAGLGQGIAAAGNVNGDEYDDIWVGGPEVYLFHGTP